LGNVGWRVAGGMGVTRETGGLLPQWANSSAAAIATADIFTLFRINLRERIVIIFASFSGHRTKESFSYYSALSQSFSYRCGGISTQTSDAENASCAAQWFAMIYH